MQPEKLQASIPALTILTWLMFALSGCGQYMMANKLNEFEDTFDQRLQIATEELSSGKVQLTYQDQIKVKGGVPPYKWVLLEGQLPEGLSLDSSTGGVVGTPKASASKVIIVQVSDASNNANWGTLVRSFLLRVE